MNRLLARLKIPFKILLAPILTTCMMVGLWGLATGGLQEQKATLTFLVDTTMPSQRAANDLTQATAGVQSALFRLLVWQEIGRKQAVIDDLNSQAQEMIVELGSIFDRLDRRAGDSVSAAVDKLGERLAQYRDNAQATRRTTYQTPGFANSMLIRTTDLYDGLIGQLQDFEERLAAQARQRVDTAAGEAGQLIRVLGLVVLIDMTVAIAVTLLLSRHLSTGIRKTTERMRAIVGGDVSTPPTDIRRSDEIGEMIAAVEVFRRTEIERRQLEQQRIEAEKQASLGGLVAGVAHELNTPIGICRTAASHLGGEARELRENLEANQLTRRQLKDFIKKTTDAAELIDHNVESAHELIQSFKQVSADQSSGEYRRIDLADYADKVVESAKPELRRSHVSVTNHLPERIVLATYAGALSQVLTNLLMNAVTHAFGPEGGTVALSGGYLPEGAEESAAEAVYLAVCDNGHGIDPASRDKVFEPFFTTQPGQGGTGLGLHLVHNVVTQNLQGRIACRSEPGWGSCFDLVLPLEAEAGPPRHFDSLPVVEPPAGSNRAWAAGA